MEVGRAKIAHEIYAQISNCLHSLPSQTTENSIFLSQTGHFNSAPTTDKSHGFTVKRSRTTPL